MKNSLHRLEKLRESLSKQAQGALGLAQKQLDYSQETYDSLQHFVLDCTHDGQATAAVLQLCELATVSAASALATSSRERDAKKVEANSRALEHKQVEKVVERREDEAVRAQNKREQNRIDDWVSSRRGAK